MIIGTRRYGLRVAFYEADACDGARSDDVRGLLALDAVALGALVELGLDGLAARDLCRA